MNSPATVPLNLNETRSVIGHLQMHAAHQCWRNEGALWHEELKLWQDELEQTRNSLTQIQAALDAHAKKLEQHGASLTLYGQDSLAHEHALVDYERGGNEEQLVVLAKKHRLESERQAHLRNAHEELKRLHHTIVARCSLLLHAITDVGSRSIQKPKTRLVKQ